MQKKNIKEEENKMNNALQEIAEIMKNEGVDRVTASKIYNQRKIDAEKIVKSMEVKQIQIEENNKKYDYYPNPKDDIRVLKDCIWLGKEGQLVNTRDSIIIIVKKTSPFVNIKDVDNLIEEMEHNKKLYGEKNNSFIEEYKKFRSKL
jgi:hypothetical protein